MKCFSFNGYLLKQWCYGLIFLNLLATAIYLYLTDYTIEDDPKVKDYGWIRWHLLTIWYNALTLLYIPICMYYDWRDKNGDGTPRMDQLRKLRDILMTLLCPVIFYCDVAFWILYVYFPSLIAPARIIETVPLWCQHTFHTISLLFVVMDLVLTPRRRPDSDKTNLTVLYGFSIAYGLDMYVNYIFGYMVYGFINASSSRACLVIVIGYIFTVTISYYAQWHIVDYFWKYKTVKFRKSKKLKS